MTDWTRISYRKNNKLGNIDPRPGKMGQCGGYDVLLDGAKVGTIERSYRSWEGNYKVDSRNARG